MCFLLKYAKLYAYYTLLTTAMSCYFLLVTLPLLQHLLMVPVGITKLFLRKITCSHAEAQLFSFSFPGPYCSDGNSRSLERLQVS